MTTTGGDQDPAKSSVPWYCWLSPALCAGGKEAGKIGNEVIEEGEKILTDAKNNPFKCKFNNKFARFHTLRNPDQPSCSTVAYLATFALVITVCIVLIFICAILPEFGILVEAADSVMDVVLLLVEYLSTGLEWLLTLWEWLYSMVVYTSNIISNGTGINPILVWLLGVEGLVAFTLVLIHNSLRLYWTFHETAAYPVFAWLNTPIRYVVDNWLTPNLGFFLTAIVEMLVFFPLEIPILAISLAWGGIHKLYSWLKGEWAARTTGLKTIRPMGKAL